MKILGKLDSAKQTNENDFTRNLNNEFLSSNSNFTDKLDNIFGTITRCVKWKNNMIIRCK